MSKRNKNGLLGSIILLLIVTILTPIITHADIEPYTLEQGIPFIGKRGDVLTYDSFTTLFKNFIRASYVIAAIAAFIKILLAGIRWYTSGGSPKAISQSREDIKNGIIGLCFLFLAGILIEFINPNLNQINSVFIGNIKVTPATPETGYSAAGTLSLIGNTGYYANGNLSSALAASGLAFDLTTGCTNTDGAACNPNYCQPAGCEKRMLCSINNGPGSNCERLSNTVCHFNGNCVDLVPTGSYADSSGKFTTAIAKLNAAGLDVLNEGLAKCSQNTTGSHLHVSLPGTFTAAQANDPECWFTAAAYAAKH